jgi:hypothetical protein
MFWSMTALGLIQISIIWTVHVLVHDSFGSNTDIMWTVRALVHEGCGSNPVMRWTVHVCVHNYFECKSGIMLTVYVLVHGSFGSNTDIMWTVHEVHMIDICIRPKAVMDQNMYCSNNVWIIPQLYGPRYNNPQSDWIRPKVVICSVLGAWIRPKSDIKLSITKWLISLKKFSGWILVYDTYW